MGVANKVFKSWLSVSYNPEEQEDDKIPEYFRRMEKMLSKNLDEENEKKRNSCVLVGDAKAIDTYLRCNLSYQRQLYEQQCKDLERRIEYNNRRQKIIKSRMTEEQKKNQIETMKNLKKMIEYIKHVNDDPEPKTDIEKIKRKLWINPITGDIEDPKGPGFFKQEPEHIYSYYRQRRFQEAKQAIKIARKVYKLKRLILVYKKELAELRENTPSRHSKLHPFRFFEHQLEAYWYKMEIQALEKEIGYWNDPLCGYKIDASDPLPSEEEIEANKSIIEKMVEKFQEFARKNIDPILKGIKEFIERNQSTLTAIANVIGTVFGAMFKIATIV